jgi:phosphatidylserine/phosphatidylglycerophosphate/cardiolipin synthase-like enzyme
VLISSQNWSEPAVTINREAGVLIEDADIASYYARIFDDDWDEAVRELEEALEEVLEGFLELDEPTDENIRRAVESGEVAQVDWSDYAEV